MKDRLKMAVNIDSHLISIKLFSIESKGVTEDDNCKSRVVGAECRYFCEENFVLSGHEKTVCQSNGTNILFFALFFNNVDLIVIKVNGIRTQHLLVMVIR